MCASNGQQRFVTRSAQQVTVPAHFYSNQWRCCIYTAMLPTPFQTEPGFHEGDSSVDSVSHLSLILQDDNPVSPGLGSCLHEPIV